MRYLILIIVVLFISCTEDPQKSITFGERKHVDSFLVKHQEELRVYYDSVCLLKNDSMVQYYFDSLLREEIESIRKLEQ